MISEGNPNEIPLNLNLDITAYLEKTWTKSNQLTKELKDKTQNEIFKYYLITLSKHLNETNSVELTDGIFDKSIQISELLNTYEWPSAELLKVPNLHRLSINFYSYTRFRINVGISKTKKQFKDASVKGCENGIDLLEILIDNAITPHGQNCLLATLFKDLFSFLALTKYKDELCERIAGGIDGYSDTNISGLCKNEIIDKSGEMNFGLGTLSEILKFKISLSKKESNIDMTVLNTILTKHEKYLRNICFIADNELVWILSVYKTIIKKDEDFSAFTIIKEIINTGKVYYSFIKASKYSDIVFYHINLLRTLMVILGVKNGVKLSENILMELMYEHYEMDMLGNASCSNIIPIKKLLKVNANSMYTEMKVNDVILQILEDVRNKEQDNLRYLNVLFTGNIMGMESDLNVDEKFLLKEFDEGNKRFDGLFSRLKN